MSNGNRISIDELNSEAFVKRVKSFDGNAFDQLCESIINPVVGYLHFQYEIDEADAEEIAADTLVKVHKALPRFDFNGGAKLSTWIFKIAINGARDFLRQQKAAKGKPDLVELDTGPGTRIVDRSAAATWGTDGHRSDGTGEVAAMLRAFESLTPEDQDILRQKQCMSYRHIAEIEGCSEGTLRVRHARALKRLKDAHEMETCNE